MTHDIERRKNRSDRPIEALRLLLESTVEQFSLQSALLASEDGLLITVAGDVIKSDTLAAYAPLLASTDGDNCIQQTISEESGINTRYEINSCNARNQRVYLVTLGDDSSNLTQAVQHGSTGTERILAA